MTDKFYVTTPLYYVNDAPHIGHAYTTIAADVLARFERLMGRNVHFLTGTDEHGEKIKQAATAQGMEPQLFADQVVEKYKNAWEKLQISYDDFIRTTEKRHTEVVQKIIEKLIQKDDVVMGTYEGWYCVPCESFWTEKELLAGGICPSCKRVVQKVKEDTLMFRQSKYADALLKHYRNHPDFVLPAERRNEMRNFVEQGLRDLSISRKNLAWGVPLPEHKPHVVYVWFDALINYISAIDYQRDDKRFTRLWPADVHLMGKEIVRFHAITWPILLMALDLPLPVKIFGHGWWTVEGEKMSKSKGNVVDPLKLADEYGVDAVRYFLLREVPFGKDGDFSITGFRTRYNADLANDLGNLLHRTLNMTEKYLDGVIPPSADPEFDDESKNFRKTFANLKKDVKAAMEELRYHDALAAIWKGVSAGNLYIDREAPWSLAKNRDPHLSEVLYNVLEFLYTAAHYIYPFMPGSAQIILDQMGINERLAEKRQPPGAVGTKIAGNRVKKGDPLFPRLLK